MIFDVRAVNVPGDERQESIEIRDGSAMFHGTEGPEFSHQWVKKTPWDHRASPRQAQDGHFAMPQPAWASRGSGRSEAAPGPLPARAAGKPEGRAPSGAL